jgi:hypothetical protein
MGIRDLFKRKVKENNAKSYTPKFKVNDVILNKKFQIIRKVVGFTEYGKNHSLFNTTQNVQYILVDIHNPLKEPSRLKEQYKVFKECVKIDDYYNKIDERMAKVLYGVKI